MLRQCVARLWTSIAQYASLCGKRKTKIEPPVERPVARIEPTLERPVSRNLLCSSIEKSKLVIQELAAVLSLLLPQVLQTLITKYAVEGATLVVAGYPNPFYDKGTACVLYLHGRTKTWQYRSFPGIGDKDRHMHCALVHNFLYAWTPLLSGCCPTIAAVDYTSADAKIYQTTIRDALRQNTPARQQQQLQTTPYTDAKEWPKRRSVLKPRHIYSIAGGCRAAPASASTPVVWALVYNVGELQLATCNIQNEKPTLVPQITIPKDAYAFVDFVDQIVWTSSSEVWVANAFRCAYILRYSIPKKAFLPRLVLPQGGAKLWVVGSSSDRNRIFLVQQFPDFGSPMSRADGSSRVATGRVVFSEVVMSEDGDAAGDPVTLIREINTLSNFPLIDDVTAHNGRILVSERHSEDDTMRWREVDFFAPIPTFTKSYLSCPSGLYFSATSF